MEDSPRIKIPKSYVIGAIAGAVAPVVAIRYGFLYDNPAGSDWISWLQSVAGSLVPLGGAPLAVYGAIAGVATVVASQGVRRLNRRRQLETRVN